LPKSPELPRLTIENLSHLTGWLFLFLPGEQDVTKQQIIDAVRDCTDKLGHVPSHNELTKMTLVSRKQVRWHFGTYTRLLRECRLERQGGGVKLDMDALLRDWAGMVRDLKKLPSLTEYEHLSKYSTSPLLYRFGVWAQIPFGMKQYIQEQGRAEEMKDVLEVIEAQARDVRPGKTLRARRQGPNDTDRAEKHGPGEGPVDLKPNGADGPESQRRGPDDLTGGWESGEQERPEKGGYGSLMRFGPMVCAPTNEQGVIFLFGAMAEDLGFVVLKMGTGYPDCEAFRVVNGDRQERVKIEVEFESRNFLKHLHDVKKCDLIVCWRHNWPECPLPVIELSSIASRRVDRHDTEAP
jgi:hypothetical protein